VSVSEGLPSAKAFESNEATTKKKGEEQKSFLSSLLSC
jgi:hypothetical protein